MPTVNNVLADECNRQSENCTYTSVEFTIYLRWLRTIRTLANLSPVIFGALATWKIVSQTSPILAAVFTFLATIIPLCYRAAKIDEAIRDYTNAAGELTNLRDRFRHAAYSATVKSAAEAEAEASPLLERLDKVRALALTPPEFFFQMAQRKVKAGHYRHDYDEERSAIGQP